MLVDSPLAVDLSAPSASPRETGELSSWTRTDFRPRWQHIAAGGLRWSGILKIAERFAVRRAISNATGKRRRIRKSTGPRIVILCYHRIGVGGIPLYSEMLPQLFEGQMRYLKNHYRVLSLAEACVEMNSAAEVDPAVVVTFDDGYRDLYAQAFPVLQRYAIPATIYLTAGAIETGRPAWYDRIFFALRHLSGTNLKIDLGEAQPRIYAVRNDAERFRTALELITALRGLPDTQRQSLCAALETGIQGQPDGATNCMLDWDQIRHMQSAGISFGCHTMNHAVVSRLDPSGMERELVDSKRLIESRIETEVRDFAYPFGKPEDCGSQATEVLAREGYRSAVTTDDGVNMRGADSFRLSRVNAGDERSVAMFAVRLNMAFLGAQPPNIEGGYSSRTPERRV